jgi:hypothetical protein
MKKDLDLINLVKSSEFSKKIYVYMSSKSADDNFDGYEDNYTFSNLNPFTIKGYVTQVSPEALVYKNYGLHQNGAVEVLCEARFKSAFLTCNKVVIDEVEYQVFKEAVGNKMLIFDRPLGLMKVILSRNG